MGRINDQSTSAFAGRAFADLDDMRAWCEEKNHRAKEVGWVKWLYVEDDKRDDGSTSHRVAELDGFYASEVIDLFKTGKPLVPMGWSEINTQKLHRSLRFKLKRGLSLESWEEWSRRHDRRAASPKLENVDGF